MEIKKGDIVLTRFPFSDLSKIKLRPALVLANLPGNDLLISQITSKPGDSLAIAIEQKDLVQGHLREKSYIRPGRLIAVDRIIISRRIGKLKKDKVDDVINQIIRIIKTM